jgi:hypothetical protein
LMKTNCNTSSRSFQPSVFFLLLLLLSPSHFRYAML